MDFGRAFTFIKDDERWMTKIGIGILITVFSPLLLFIPLALLFGYQMAVTRQVMNGKDLPLPEWDDWGKLFRDGIYFAIALFIYALPLWIILCLAFSVFFLPILGGGTGNEDFVAALGGVAVLTYFALLCVVFILGLGLTVVVPGIYIQYIRTNEFAAMFRFSEVFAIVRENIADILLAIVASFGANLAVSAVSSFLSWTICIPFVLGFAAPIWINISLGHLYGQIAAKNKMAAL
jgi:hypothetical protein